MVRIAASTIITFLGLCLISTAVAETKTKVDPIRDALKNKKLPKNPLDMSDLDMEHLYDQWEDPDDDIPESHKQQIPSSGGLPGGLTDEMLSDPEKLLRISKKGRTVMAFVTVANNPTRQQTEELTQRWQVGLSNNHVRCQRFVIDQNRAIFVFDDGALAIEAKDYLVAQPELKEYSIDNKVWHGKGYPVEYRGDRSEL